MAISGITLAVAIGLNSTQFALDTDTPDALCPELSQTRDAVEKRLGQLDVDGGGLWRGRYRIVHDPEGRRGDYVILTITDPSGQEQLNRELPIQGESCATLTQAIALVVDGFFRDLGQSPTLDVTAPPQPAPSATVPEMAATPVAAPAVQTKPVSPPVAEPSPAPASSGDHFRLGWVLGTGYESAVRSAAVDLGWFGATPSGWRFALHAAVPFSQYSETVTPGTAELFAVPVRLSVLRQLDLTSGLNVFLGPELLLSVERGWTHGLASERRGYRATWGLGGQLGAAYSLWSRGGLAIRLSGDRVIADASAFTVEGESVLTLPRLRWSVALQLWGLVF